MSSSRSTKRLEEPLPALTPETTTRLDTLLEQLAEVRRSGIAFDREEHHRGISAIGAAIANSYGLALAISVPVPTSRFVDREDDIVEEVLKSKRRIEEHLAHVVNV